MEINSSQAVSKGIPQRSWLGPIIFNVVMNHAFILYRNMVLLIMQIMKLFQQ